VALTMAIGRVGWLLTEQPGSPSSLPWGVHVSATAGLPHCAPCLVGQAMRPSFAYEIAFHVMAFVVLLRPRVQLPGHLSTLNLFWYVALRFLVECTHGNEIVPLGLSRSQLFLIPSMVLLAVPVGNRRSRPGPDPRRGLSLRSHRGVPTRSQARRSAGLSGGKP
jgi:phosphatidylglycerol:prolipoprotein diacylglycerol transferase